jgi:MFS family permease
MRRGLNRFSHDYWLLWASNAGSALADGMRIATLPLLAAATTESALGVASVTTAATLPWLLLGLPAGAVVDRVERRKVMTVATAARVVVVGVIAAWILVETPPLALIIAAAFLLGAADAFGVNAGLSMVAAVVPDHRDLERANGWLSLGFTVCNEFLGPPIGAALFAIAAFAAFGVDALLLFLAAVAVWAMTVKAVQDDDEADPMAHAIRLGLGQLWNDGPMRSVTLGLGVLALCDAAWFAVLVLYVRHVLGGTDTAFGVLLAVGAIGAVVGSVVADRLATRLGSNHTLVLALLLAAAGQVGLGLTSSIVVAALMSALCAFAFTIWNVVASAFRQRRVPDQLLGRVTGTYLLVGHGATAIGALAGGVLANAFGLRTPFVVGVPILVLAAIVLRRPSVQSPPASEY